MIIPAPLPCAIFLLLAIGLAGVAHVAWLRSPWSLPFARAIDGGLLLRNHRIFGDNKTVRGLMMMPPASAATFALFAAYRDSLPSWFAAGIWDLPTAQMAVVGFFCGLAFMLAELPNSMFKRQLDVAPGEAPAGAALRMFCLFLDRTDSTLGVLIVLSIMLPVHPLTWLWTLLLGTGLHWIFSIWLYRLNLKRRPS
jgi:CDP-2,3-bis-(O-geranylgeranyl)-sn-glycerol synthase